MLKESSLDKILYRVKKLIPGSVFNFFQPYYHAVLAYAGAAFYGFPSRKLKVIGVTGTKGKSTVVYLASKLLEARLQGGQKPGFGKSGVAACGSLGFKIKSKEWPNTLKMTMPGRFRLQKLMAEAVRAGCEYFILEVTSEGIKQKRHLGIWFDCAVFTNLHKEHIESHGSFENYYQAKQELFRRTKNIHVINADDQYTKLLGDFPAEHKIFYGFTKGDLVAGNLKLSDLGSSFEVYGTTYNIHLAGKFNILNCLAVLSIGAMYGIDLPSAKHILESVKFIPGRMEFIPAFVKTSAGEQKEPFKVVVDYAHTPESLRSVYETLKNSPLSRKASEDAQNTKRKLICILGAAGGGRDKWKRPEFGRIAAQYCDEIILTNEDPYEENPEAILEEIASGFSQAPNHKSSRFYRGSSIAKQSGQITNKSQAPNVQKIMDRKEAIKKALTLAQEGDTVIITGKGSETSMAVSGNRKIPWSDKGVIEEFLTTKY